MVGQLPSAADDIEQPGITLAKLEHRWLIDAGKASVLT
jgi:hypothetical protein